MPVDLGGIARVLKRSLPLPLEGVLRLKEHSFLRDPVDLSRGVLVVDDCSRATADDLEALSPGLEAVVAVLKVAEIIFVERPDSLVDLAPDVDASEDDTFDLRIGVKLVDI